MIMRIVTGLVLAAALAAALYFGGWVMWTFLTVAAMAALWEFYALFWKGKHLGLRLFGLLLGLLLMFAASPFPNAGITGMFGAVPIVLCAFLLAWSRNAETRFENSALLLTGLVYIPLMLIPALGMGVKEQLFVVGTSAVSDTAAYFSGVKFGKHKIWPVVSPKKSVEGALAGAAGSVLWSLALGYTWGDLPLSVYALVGLGMGIASQLGDFFESGIKRACNVKDSGMLLPGHGGFLDRIDSLLFVVPVYTLISSFVILFRV